MPEVEAWLQQTSRSRSRGRERPSPRWTSSGRRRSHSETGRNRSQDINILRRQGSAANPEEVAPFALKSSADEYRNSLQSGKEMPIKVLIDEEMSKKMEPKRTPSVIAKLMGLDTLPTSQFVSKEKQKSEILLRESSFREKSVPCKEQLPKHTKDKQEFKDVYEVTETSVVGKYMNPPSQRGLPRPKRSEKDINFVRQKFLEAKRLSTDENLQNSKNFNEALDVLDSNRDLFLKFLQEPSSLFSKHLEDLHSVSSKPRVNHITLLKPSKASRFQSPEVYSSPERSDSHADIEMDIKNHMHKYEYEVIDRHNRQKSLSFSRKLAESKVEEKAKHPHLPTRIVVLKPSLEKTQSADRSASIPCSMEKDDLSYGSDKEGIIFRTNKLFSDASEKHRLLVNQRVVRHGIGKFQEFPKDTAKTLRHSVKHGSLNLFGCNDFEKNGCSRKIVGKSSILEAGALAQASGYFDDCNKPQFSSPSSSTDTSVSRQARKLLSERWKTHNNYKRGGLVGEGPSTLGEMLALSDRETPSVGPVNRMHPRLDFPSGISSKDGWKDRFPKKLPRSRSLPSSSTLPSSTRHRNRTGSFGDGDSVMLKDLINFASDKSPEGNFSRQKVVSPPLYENSRTCKPSVSLDAENMRPTTKIIKSHGVHRSTAHLTTNKCSETSTPVFYDAMALIDDGVSSENHDEERHTANDCELPLAAVTSEPAVDVGDRDGSSFSKVVSPDHIRLDSSKFASRTWERELHPIPDLLAAEPKSPTALSFRDGETESALIPKDDDHASPVSVLDGPDEEEMSSPGSFEKLSADLQELRLQLQLLKLQKNVDENGADMVSVEDVAGDCFPQSQIAEMLQISTDEDDRDYSYLVDMLTDSGLHDTFMDMISAASYLPESPVGPETFNKLEKIYDVPAEWSRAERKLLFDHVNSIIREVIEPYMDLHPWVSYGRTLVHGRKLSADEIWHLLVRRRREVVAGGSVLDLCFLDVRDNIDVLGREVEKMLRDDLLNEVVSDLLF